MINRRQFFQATAGAAIALAWPRRAYSYAQSPLGITKFSVALPGLGPNDIPVLTPNKTKYPGTDYYEIVARQFTQQLHDKLPPTTFFGYADAATLNNRYLGGVIVANRRTPVRLKVTNLLPEKHILPIDQTLMSDEVGGGRQGQGAGRRWWSIHLVFECKQCARLRVRLQLH